MKLVKVKRTAAKNYAYTKLYRILSEFIESDQEIAEVVLGKNEYVSYNSAVSALNASAKRFKFTNVRAFYRLGHVFLMRVSNDD